MARSIQGSAIDDSFETLTNAPDAWVSGRDAQPPTIDYQHYVEPGDARSAIDDRCFTEYGAVEYSHYVNTPGKPPKTDQGRHRSRPSPTRPVPRGKRRPSPSFRIRSKDGESIVMSNPFVLRKPSRARSEESASRPETLRDEDSQQCSTTSACSRTFKIRIRGKNGEEAIQEIKRPLHFASQSDNGKRVSQATTAVGDESDAKVKYWSANSSVHRRDQSPSGLVGFTDFVTDSKHVSSMAPSTVRSSLKMSGALPTASVNLPTKSTRSSMLPPSKPTSSSHNSGIHSHVPGQSTKDSGLSSHRRSRSASHHTDKSSKTPSLVRSTRDVVLVPDDSIEGSVVASFSALPSHSDSAPRPTSPLTFTVSSEADQVLEDTASNSEHVSSRCSSSPSAGKSSRLSSTYQSISSLTSSKNSTKLPSQRSIEAAQEGADGSWPATVSLSKHESPKQDAYYNWKVPRDSLDSTSTNDSKSGASLRGSAVSESRVFTLSENSSRSGGVSLHQEDKMGSDTSSSTRTDTVRQASPQRERVHFISSSACSSGKTSEVETWGNESTSRITTASPKSIPLPSSPTISSKSRKSRPSLNSSRRSRRSSSLDRPHIDQTWETFQSEAKSHSERVSSRQAEYNATEWSEAAKREKMPMSHHSNRSTPLRSHRSQPHESTSSRHRSVQSSDQDHDAWEPVVETNTGSNTLSDPTIPINIEGELLPFLSTPSDDEPLPPPMPILTPIYEEPEPSSFSHALSCQSQTTTRYARPGAISPHPLSSVSSASIARKPPSVEPQRLEYHRTYVESRSTSSASSGAHESSRRTSRPRMLEQGAHRSAREGSRSHGKRGESLETARSERRKGESKKISLGGWKLW